MAYNKIGTTGGEGGLAFDNYQVPEGARLREIRLLCDQYVNALQLIYTDADGNIGELRPVGGLSGQLQVFTLEDGEYLTGISGRSGWYIDSLKFNTNKRSSETYGGTGGETYFQIDAPKNTELPDFTDVPIGIWTSWALSFAIYRKVVLPKNRPKKRHPQKQHLPKK